MISALAHDRERLLALCRQYGVRRLDVFGSAATGDFDEQSSDIDFLVEFEDLPFADRADAYLGLLTGLELLFGRRIDLVEAGAIRNPYIRQDIEQSRTLLYAA
jgi:predicted nucleotidyltransferase